MNLSLFVQVVLTSRTVGNGRSYSEGIIHTLNPTIIKSVEIFRMMLKTFSLKTSTVKFQEFHFAKFCIER